MYKRFYITPPDIYALVVFRTCDTNANLVQGCTEL
jgi:hypothetical protein